ncbi:MAG: hypothetical protein LAT57_00490 [Balneolales bacterium]|nr:hypothetical protein [Balneolales bacterium]
MAAMVIIALITAPDVLAQGAPPPPALPGMPDQAPLGGLGLLAAAGGAYAWKKLRTKKD